LGVAKSPFHLRWPQWGILARGRGSMPS
jgi:hypothetical protein